MKLRQFQVTVMLVLAAACDRSGAPKPKPEPASGTAATTPPPAHAACTLAALPAKRPQPKRVIAIGDLHGDLGGTRAALKTAGVIDDNDHWIGKDTVVVQTGDVLDRGDDEQAILDLVFKLEADAKAAGGEFVMLLGNHELMNAAGDYRYVTPGALDDFEGGRAAALGPGGTYARKLAAHDVIAIVGDTIYSHAGVLGDWVTHVGEVNMTSRCWLDGQSGGPDAAPIAMQSEESPVWTRAVGLDPVDCSVATASLAKLGVKRMVVGHTVQKHINSVCDGAVWRIDVGLAKLYDGPIEVLELVDGQPPKILTGSR